MNITIISPGCKLAQVKIYPGHDLFPTQEGMLYMIF
jgi:hypothetical protein